VPDPSDTVVVHRRDRPIDDDVPQDPRRMHPTMFMSDL
jgi:hypothetical protein